MMPADHLRRTVAGLCAVFFGLISITAASVHAQLLVETKLPVTYVSAALVYVDGGRDRGIAAGDTLFASRGILIVDAVARSSSAAHPLDSALNIVVGEFLTHRKITSAEVIKPPLRDPSVRDTNRSPRAVPAKAQVAPSTENIVSGRAALQYIGIFSDNASFDYSQPSLMTRLEIGNIYGTGMRFSAYGRSYYNLSDNYKGNGDNTRLQFRPYEFLFENGDPNARWGYTVGRATSRYVSGLGTFDGGQAYVRQGDFTLGAIFGAEVENRDMSIDGDDKKGALFLNYRWIQDFSHQYEGTVAYGRILNESKLDREFLYIQNSASINSNISFYQSSEFDLQTIDHGVTSGAFQMTNTFATLNATPMQWLSLNFGYDASRSIYLFESMKAIPDTLFDKNLLHGYRLNFSIKLPASVTVGGTAAYRNQSGDSRTSKTLAGFGRISNLLQTELNLAARYARIDGIFSDGNDITIDVDRTFFSLLSLSLRLDRYNYSLVQTGQNYMTTTLTLNASCRLSRALYSVIAVDRVWESTGNSYRLYAETGVRF